MKYLILVSLLFVGCSLGETTHKRLVKEATQYCACHGGIQTLLYSSSIFHLTCKDSSHIKVKGPTITSLRLVSGCK